MPELDKEARFVAALEDHRDALYRICCAYGRDEADRKDLYQEVLIQVWKSLETFQGRSKLATWLYRVAVNTCLSWLRREKRRCGAIARAAEEPESAVLLPEIRAGSTSQDDVQQLYRCVGRLAPVDRLLVSLYLEEADTSEMASVLGLTEGNVRVKIHRIKHQLQRLWEKENEESR